MIKSKQARQKWWRNLPENKRKEFIDKKVAQKGIKRWVKDEKQSLKLVKKREYQGKFCVNCFHLKTKSCSGLKEINTSVCKDWFEIKGQN